MLTDVTDTATEPATRPCCRIMHIRHHKAVVVFGVCILAMTMQMCLSKSLKCTKLKSSVRVRRLACEKTNALLTCCMYLLRYMWTMLTGLSSAMLHREPSAADGICCWFPHVAEGFLVPSPSATVPGMTVSSLITHLRTVLGLPNDRADGRVIEVLVSDADTGTPLAPHVFLPPASRVEIAVCNSGYGPAGSHGPRWTTVRKSTEHRHVAETTVTRLPAPVTSREYIHAFLDVVWGIDLVHFVAKPSRRIGEDIAVEGKRCRAKDARNASSNVGYAAVTIKRWNPQRSVTLMLLSGAYADAAACEEAALRACGDLLLRAEAGAVAEVAPPEQGACFHADVFTPILPTNAMMDRLLLPTRLNLKFVPATDEQVAAVRTHITRAFRDDPTKSSSFWS
jgi:hypothetical protein